MINFATGSPGLGNGTLTKGALLFAERALPGCGLGTEQGSSPEQPPPKAGAGKERSRAAGAGAKAPAERRELGDRAHEVCPRPGPEARPNPAPHSHPPAPGCPRLPASELLSERVCLIPAGFGKGRTLSCQQHPSRVTLSFSTSLQSISVVLEGISGKVKSKRPDFTCRTSLLGAPGCSSKACYYLALEPGPQGRDSPKRFSESQSKPCSYVFPCRS